MQMMTPITARTLILIIKMSFFITLLSLTSNVHAEYYLVYPAPTCIDCDDYYYRNEAPYYSERHHRHSKHPRVHIYRNTLSGYYSADCGAGSVSGCNGARWVPVEQPSDDYVGFSHQPTSYRHAHYYSEEDWRYDPDLATGDDDQIRHPDMQIN